MTRDIAWLLQKLAGNSFDVPRIAPTVILEGGKPLKVFFKKEGTLQCEDFTASAELFQHMRKWLGIASKRSESPEHQRDKYSYEGCVEVCSVHFLDGAVHTLAKPELDKILLQSRPKKSQWMDAKLVQLLPNAGSTFDHPLHYINTHYDKQLSRKSGCNQVEDALDEMQRMLNPLSIVQGDFVFAQNREWADGEYVDVLYLLDATNLHVRKIIKEDEKPPQIEIDAEVSHDPSFIEAIENRPPTRKMMDVLEQLDTLYGNTVSCVNFEEETRPTSPSSSRRRSSTQSYDPACVTPVKPPQYFFGDPPICPPTPRKHDFWLPPRPRSVGDLLGTSASSTWFKNDQRARRINDRPRRPSTTGATPSLDLLSWPFDSCPPRPATHGDMRPKTRPLSQLRRTPQFPPPFLTTPNSRPATVAYNLTKKFSDSSLPCRLSTRNIKRQNPPVLRSRPSTRQSNRTQG